MTFARARRQLSGTLGSKPLSAMVLLALAAATYLDWYWPWGLLFLYWVIVSLRAREAFLIERVTRIRNPLLYWAITGMWGFFGLWAVVADLAWRLA
ncbi:MAG: hypothetical protein OXE40_09555 [Gammaproteobacteria bacterium]|nr:hypothetical protein [Gammaproteobacteria bacterium]